MKKAVSAKPRIKQVVGDGLGCSVALQPQRIIQAHKLEQIVPFNASVSDRVAAKTRAIRQLPFVSVAVIT